MQEAGQKAAHILSKNKLLNPKRSPSSPYIYGFLINLGFCFISYLIAIAAPLHDLLWLRHNLRWLRPEKLSLRHDFLWLCSEKLS
jgi:hypothetical protein